MAPLDGDPLLVERLVANLLTNGGSATSVIDGRVEVVAEMKGRKSHVVGDKQRTSHPANRSRSPLSALSAAQSAPGALPRDGYGARTPPSSDPSPTLTQASISAHPVPDGGLFVTVSFPQSLDPDLVSRRQVVDALD